MTWGRIIDGVKYIYLMNYNDFKKKSLYDNVYFTLRDIFANAESFDTMMESNSFTPFYISNADFQQAT